MGASGLQRRKKKGGCSKFYQFVSISLPTSDDLESKPNRNRIGRLTLVPNKPKSELRAKFASAEEGLLRCAGGAGCVEDGESSPGAMAVMKRNTGVIDRFSEEWLPRLKPL